MAWSCRHARVPTSDPSRPRACCPVVPSAVRRAPRVPSRAARRRRVRPGHLSGRDRSAGERAGLGRRLLERRGARSRRSSPPRCPPPRSSARARPSTPPRSPGRRSARACRWSGPRSTGSISTPRPAPHRSWTPARASPPPTSRWRRRTATRSRRPSRASRAPTPARASPSPSCRSRRTPSCRRSSATLGGGEAFALDATAGDALLIRHVWPVAEDRFVRLVAVGAAERLEPLRSTVREIADTVAPRP